MKRAYGRKRNYRKKRTYKGKYTRKGKQTFAKKGNFVSQRFVVKNGTRTLLPGFNQFYDFQPSLFNISPPELAAYQELYDEYRIVGIKLTMIPQISSAQVDAFGGNIPNHYIVTDKNDSSSLGTVGQALEYNNCKMKPLTRTLSRYTKPSVTVLQEDTVGNKFVQEQPPRWIQLDNSVQPNNITVEHLGIKYITDTNNSGVPITVTIYETLWVQFRTKV